MSLQSDAPELEELFLPLRCQICSFTSSPSKTSKKIKKSFLLCQLIRAVWLIAAALERTLTVLSWHFYPELLQLRWKASVTENSLLTKKGGAVDGERWARSGKVATPTMSTVCLSAGRSGKSPKTLASTKWHIDGSSRKTSGRPRRTNLGLVRGLITCCEITQRWPFWGFLPGWKWRGSAPTLARLSITFCFNTLIQVWIT